MNVPGKSQNVDTERICETFMYSNCLLTITALAIQYLVVASEALLMGFYGSVHSTR